MKMKKNKQTPKQYPENLKEYLTKLAKVQVLINDKEFQKKVKRLRLKWGIHKTGFKSKKECRIWFENSPKKILKQPKTVEQTEKEIIYGGGNTKIVYEWTLVLLKGITPDKKICLFPFGSFLTDVNSFLIENNIDETLSEIFLSYLYYDNLSETRFPKQAVEVSERITSTKSRGKISHLIHIAIGPNTRQKDITEIWTSQICPLQVKLPGYLQKKTRTKTNS